jgi:hypothetical protein
VWGLVAALISQFLFGHVRFEWFFDERDICFSLEVGVFVGATVLLQTLWFFTICWSKNFSPTQYFQYISGIHRTISINLGLKINFTDS